MRRTLPHPLYKTAAAFAAAAGGYVVGKKISDVSSSYASERPEWRGTERFDRHAVNFDAKSITKEIYRNKSTTDLVRAALAFKLCSSQFLVDHSMTMLFAAEKVFGPKLTFETAVKWTMFDHFCGGTGEKDLGAAIETLSKVKLAPILDYAAEARVTDKPNVHLTGLMRNPEKVQYTSHAAELDANVDRFKMCFETGAAQRPEGGVAFAAVKLSGLFEPQLLARITAILTSARQQWVMVTRPDAAVPELEECRIVLDSTLPEVESGRYCDAKTFAAGVARLHPDLSTAEVDAMVKALDCEKAGRVDFFDYALSMASTTLGYKDGQCPEIRPLLRQCALTEEESVLLEQAKSRLKTVIETAMRLNIRVMIDAEQSYYQMAIDEIVRNMQRDFNKSAPMVLNTYQCYLKITPQRILNDLARADREGWAFGGKIVCGAYVMEENNVAKEFGYTSPVQPNEEATHRCYDHCATLLLDAADARTLKLAAKVNADAAAAKATSSSSSSSSASAAVGSKVVEGEGAAFDHMYGKQSQFSKLGLVFASHNTASLKKITSRTDRSDLEFVELGFGQLYGMADHLSVPLADAGYTVYKYLPYGPVKETLAYLHRRAQENSAMLRKPDGEYSLVKLELKRRFWSR